MTIHYSIGKEDFLTYQLYTASKSAHIRRQRRRSKIAVLVLYMLIGFYGYFTDRLLFAGLFFLSAIIWIIFYPAIERRRYINHYKRFIEENYQGRIGQQGVLTFSRDFLTAKEGANDSKIATAEIEKITEIDTTFFIKMKNGLSLILPKGKISPLAEFTTYLKEFAQELQISYSRETNWKWR